MKIFLIDLLISKNSILNAKRYPLSKEQIFYIAKRSNCYIKLLQNRSVTILFLIILLKSISNNVFKLVISKKAKCRWEKNEYLACLKKNDEAAKTGFFLEKLYPKMKEKARKHPEKNLFITKSPRFLIVTIIK